MLKTLLQKPDTRLETSMTMYGWLDEESRKLLFNQEDYNKLSKELNVIENKTLRLQTEYEDKLKNATLETVESITSEYEMQYKTLMKSYEIAKADLEIAKKKQQLNNVLNERNVRMFLDGQWQWLANTEDVAKAKSELADAEYAKRVEESGLTQQKSIDALTRQQNELNVVVKKFESGVIDLGTAIGAAKDAIGILPYAVDAMFSNITSSKYYPSSSSKSGSSSSSSSGSSSYNSDLLKMQANSAMWKATLPQSVKDSLHDENVALGNKLGLTYDPDSGKWKKPDGTNAYASGTKNTKSGLSLLGEEGFEAYIAQNGRLIPITQPTIGNLGSGGIVFNSEQMSNLRSLWNLGNLNMNPSSAFVNKQPQQIDQSQDNRIIINGMTVDSGSADGQALINALRRYVGNH